MKSATWKPYYKAGEKWGTEVKAKASKVAFNSRNLHFKMSNFRYKIPEHLSVGAVGENLWKSGLVWLN